MSNQATLGNGCVCDSGCPRCDALAEAWPLMISALHQGLGWVEADPGGPGSETARMIREAIRLAKVARD